MDSFQAHYTDIRDPSQQPRVVALLRDEGLVTFSGITDRTELAAVAGGSWPSGRTATPTRTASP